jgi:hypothetical protein
MRRSGGSSLPWLFVSNDLSLHVPSGEELTVARLRSLFDSTDKLGLADVVYHRMSHLLKSPAFRWACWYSPEIVGSALLATTAAVLVSGPTVVVGLAGAPVIGLRKPRVCGATRRATERRQAAAAQLVTAEEARS